MLQTVDDLNEGDLVIISERYIRNYNNQHRYAKPFSGRDDYYYFIIVGSLDINFFVVFHLLECTLYSVVKSRVVNNV